MRDRIRGFQSTRRQNRQIRLHCMYVQYVQYLRGIFYILELQSCAFLSFCFWKTQPASPPSPVLAVCGPDLSWAQMMMTMDFHGSRRLGSARLGSGRAGWSWISHKLPFLRMRSSCSDLPTSSAGLSHYYARHARIIGECGYGTNSVDYTREEDVPLIRFFVWHLLFLGRGFLGGLVIDDSVMICVVFWCLESSLVSCADVSECFKFWWVGNWLV